VKNKYKNKKTSIVKNGKTYYFDSIKESLHFELLYNMLISKKITNLILQPEFEILPSIKWNNKTLKKIKYIADFSYEQNGIKYIVDVKGYRTDVYKLKMRLFLMKYSEYQFVEI